MFSCPNLALKAWWTPREPLVPVSLGGQKTGLHTGKRWQQQCRQPSMRVDALASIRQKSKQAKTISISFQLLTVGATNPYSGWVFYFSGCNQENASLVFPEAYLIVDSRSIKMTHNIYHPSKQCCDWLEADQLDAYLVPTSGQLCTQ